MTGPKEGSTAFYKGYSAGYNRMGYDASGLSWSDSKNYDEGFDKGSDDKKWGNEQYRYVEPGKVSTPNTGVWPFPNR